MEVLQEGQPPHHRIKGNGGANHPTTTPTDMDCCKDCKRYIPNPEGDGGGWCRIYKDWVQESDRFCNTKYFYKK